MQLVREVLVTPVHMHQRKNPVSWIVFLLVITFIPSAWSQNTIIKGKVTDKTTGEDLITANVSFPGTSIGAVTDFDGSYRIVTDTPGEWLHFSYLGYRSDSVRVEAGVEQVINVALEEDALTLQDVVVVAKKRKRYNRREDPAFILAQQVIDNKEKNRLESHEFYQYDKYEKIQLDLNNITDKFRNRRALRKYQFIFEYVDTSNMNGKTYLPIYLQENSSTVYYRDDPESQKEYQHGKNVTELEGILDEASIASVTERLVQNVDIYDGNIEFLANQFIGPTNSIARQYYNFEIQDTFVYKGRRVVDLFFTPRNDQNFAFQGFMYVGIDDNYRIIKVEMGINTNININFVRDVSIEQEYDVENDVWILSKDKVKVDYALFEKGMGVFGTRTVSYRDYVFGKKMPENIYSGAENIIIDKGAYEKDSTFWLQARHDTLDQQEVGVTVMVDSLQRVPAFKRMVKLATLLFSGYTDVGPIDIGPINSFYSFNDVEGFRMRLGFRTNLKMAKKWQLEAYGAYGFQDKAYKGYGGFTYSFNEDFQRHPRHYFKLSAHREVKFPGQVLEYITEDNFLLSFRRGRQDNMLYFTNFRTEYYQETDNNLTFQVIAENRNHEPHPRGSLKFALGPADANPPTELDNIRTTEAKFRFQWAPNARYLNTKNYRYNLINRYPIFNVYYTAGLDLLGGDYNYHFTKLNIFKRFYLSIFGETYMELEGGKYFGENLPYILLHLPRANQTYAYQNNAYNMMNYLEFISDEYVSINMRHYFNGFFFNKIPLIRKLKLREIITFKGLWGRLTDPNNPDATMNLVQLPTDEDGVPLSFTLDDEPYMEASVGIGNIFKVLRVDMVKRLNYNDLPNTPGIWGVPGLGIRVRGSVAF